MSFDFFNEGLKKETAIEFTKEQNAQKFLQSKLPFLDPKKTKQISIGTALQFLKFSGIRSEGIQKILRNCKIQTGTKTIDYAQMKKIFRGVALHQADIEPSTINIEANIKTKLPIFYDDQSDDEEPKPEVQASKPPAPKPQPPVQTLPASTVSQPKPHQNNNQPPQEKPVNDKQGVFSFDAPVKPSSQKPPSEAVVSPTFLPQQSQAQDKESALAIKLRQFEARWAKLKTNGNKIEGSQVKNLFKNSGQRSNLSKAWKLCCLNHSGALTKGEFYVFLELITSPQLPESLTPDMKHCISILDHPTKNPQSKENLQPQPRVSVQNPSFTKLASSQLFQNFGKAESTVDVRGRVKTEQKIEPLQSQKLQKARSQLHQVSKVVENHNEQLTIIRRGQESMNNLMGEMEQFLTAVKGRNSEVKEQMEELKHNQQLLNERLNKVCVAMNGIIVHQNSLIEELVNDYTAQNNLSQQRVAFLENHVAQLTEQLQQKAIAIKRITQKTEQPEQPPARPAPEKQTPPLQKQPHDEPEAAEVVHQAPQPPSSQERHHQDRPRIEQEAKPQEDNEYQQRMKLKRAQVIQLIMHLTPLSPEEEPALIQRINQYSEQELNTVYYNCYQKLKARQLAQQQQAERIQQAEQARVSHAPEDQFSSSHFNGQPSTTQEDMFG